MKNIYFYPSDIGKLGVVQEEQAITRIYFQNENIPEDLIEFETDLIKEAGQQIQEYFAGKRKDFTIPLAPNGTPFMQSVWKALIEIPYGETRSYKDVAESIENPKAVRAVGMANNRNPLPIVIPCHRVIGANGKLVGYGGGLDIKILLLDLEKKHGNI
ncbi:methylated-DNA--[protein]-cysteine S-methyltransferase [Bacillus massiliigorillae]|uniref:methylated-DNA--[protein]-cysteine S-methyltransferase n=1 Tax=Bacillus massiliigorillae TaxID=1243664 RepID=UPI0003A3F48C|nr:methylated-DNA--[protein]-cysteine S-methyltransferase [Bacillus massiliigorillae]